MTAAADIGPDGRDRTAKRKGREREKAKRRKRTPEARAAEHLKRQARDATAKARDEAARASSPPARVPYQPLRTLVRVDDSDHRVIERRRFDCAHLAACEDAWVRTNGERTAQGKCLLGCRGFEARDFERPISIGGRGGVSLG